jgi:hypothetical protein
VTIISTLKTIKIQNLVGAPNERSQVCEERFLRFRAAVESGERVELAARQYAIAGQGGTVIDGSRGQIDPNVSVLRGPDGAEAIGEGRGRFGL